MPGISHARITVFGLEEQCELVPDHLRTEELGIPRRNLLIEAGRAFEREGIAVIDPTLMPRGNENGARLNEGQRLLAPVMASHWIVLLRQK